MLYQIFRLFEVHFFAQLQAVVFDVAGGEPPTGRAVNTNCGTKLGVFEQCKV
jgi:hypothetical protein